MRSGKAFYITGGLLLLAALLFVSSCKMFGGLGSAGGPGFAIVEETSISKPGGGIDTKTRTTFVADGGLMVDEGDKVMLITLKGKNPVMYSIMHAEKKAQDMSSFAPMLIAGLFFFDCDSEGSCTDKLGSVDPTDEYQTIGGLKARKVKISGIGTATTGWFSMDSPDLIDANEARKRFFMSLARAGGKKVNKITSKTDEYGAMVMSEMSMGQISIKSRFVSVEKKEIPGDFFKVPEGYEIVDMKIPGS